MGTVLITGISSGLGAGLVRFYLEQGWRVYGLSRRAPERRAVEGDLSFQSVDLADLDTIDAGLQRLTSGLSELDLVILNAGVLGEIQDLQDTSVEAMKRIMDVNLWSNKILIDSLLSRVAVVRQVVAISSGASINGHRGWGAYSLSKAALNMLMQLYAGESETHFSALAPGLVDTTMQEYMYTDPDVLRFPSVQRLRDARYTDAMPEPYLAAQRLHPAFEKLRAMPSGSYADVRKM